MRRGVIHQKLEPLHVDMRFNAREFVHGERAHPPPAGQCVAVEKVETPQTRARKKCTLHDV